MASKLFLIIALPILIALPFLAYQSSAEDVAPTTRVPPRTICMYTPNPFYCTSALPNQMSDVYSYCRFSISKVLWQSRKFLSLVESYLKPPTTLSVTAIRALEDCRLLTSLSIDYLSSTYQTVNTTSKVLPTVKADDLQTLLSAILTNKQTCLEGLQAVGLDRNVENVLSVPLSEDSKLCSVSLALFKKGWVGERKRRTAWWRTSAQRLLKDGRLLLKMSNRTRAIYEHASERNQSGDNGVVVRDIVTVSKDGRGNFTTITDAVSAAPNNTDVADGYFLIYITAGVYEENISIDTNKKNLMMIGAGIGKTIITGNRNADDGWTTFNSATVAVVAQNFTAVDITFRNTAGPEKHQAVALRGGADLSTFYRCSFEGYQAVLYTHSLRQFYRECEIYGTIDFIFGNAAVVLQNCNIYLRLPMSGQFNVISAQGRTDPNQNTGISIHNCTITAAEELASSNRTVRTYLGRPWREYSRTVIMQSFLDSLINPDGWSVWSGDFAMSTLYYAEYNNTGPGSDTTYRVTWPGYHVINAADAANFTVSDFLSGDDWLPKTGVRYTPALI